MAVATKPVRTARDVAAITRESPVVYPPASLLIRLLTRQIANAFVLYMDYKQCHWRTYGPAFRDLHLFLGEFAQEVLESIDHLAECIHMIGRDRPAHLIEALDRARLLTAAPHSSLREMVEEADRAVRVVLNEMQQTTKIAHAHGEPRVVSLAERFVNVLQRHESSLRDILRKRDGAELF